MHAYLALFLSVRLFRGDKNVQKSCMQRRRTTENNYFKLYCIGLLDVCNLKFICL